ncbi:hypothetical protein [Bradyrhizobium diazoefficiens]|uniref:hypothetical protein n=1 Tax=Bradyrhizobium diazoefficiens TaxID=1355477 RepID=UPI001FEE0BDB|nr:hypothetical protein [Bradyrhizobium diazoefficiens]
MNLTLRKIVGLRVRRKLVWPATAEIIEPPEHLAIRLTSAAVAKEKPMIPGRMTTKLNSIDRMFLKIRELIDTDDSIPLELRASLHTTLDRHLRLAKEGFFKTPVRSQ